MTLGVIFSVLGLIYLICEGVFFWFYSYLFCVNFVNFFGFFRNSFCFMFLSLWFSLLIWVQNVDK